MRIRSVFSVSDTFVPQKFHMASIFFPLSCPILETVKPERRFEMKNNNFVKTIFVLAAMLIVFSLSVSAFAEAGKNTSGEISEVTFGEGSAEAEEKTYDAAAEATDSDTTPEENEENSADSGAEKPAKHHKGRKPTAPESGTEAESNPEEGLSRDQNRRSDKKNKEDGNAEDGKKESFKKHSSGKAFEDDDEDDDDDDDDEKEYCPKDRFGHSKRNSSRQQSESTEGSAGKTPRHGCSHKHGSSKKESVTMTSEQVNNEGENGDGVSSEAEAVAVEETTEPEAVTEDIPETEADGPAAERITDAA